MNAIDIKKVANKKDLNKFILFPWKIYRGKNMLGNWAPPLLIDAKSTLNQKKNPFFLHAESDNFLAYRNGEIVGRITATVDQNFNEYHKEATGFLGFFESVNDLSVAKTLFETAEEWLCKKGMNKVIGPMNPSSNDVLGVLLDHYDNPPSILMPYNPPYYIDLFEQSGYQKEKDLCSYSVDPTFPLSDKVKRVVKFVRSDNTVTVRPINMKKINEEVEKIRLIYNDAWRDNWGFVPWTKEEMAYLAKSLKLIGIPNLVLLALIDDQPVGFSLTLPDINQAIIHTNGRLFPTGLIRLLWYRRHPKRVRVVCLGICKKYQNQGIDALFYHDTYQNSYGQGIREGVFSWILEDNVAVRQILDSWGAKLYKHYRVYGKAI